jgi:hypothetical protein
MFHFAAERLWLAVGLPQGKRQQQMRSVCVSLAKISDFAL